MSIFRREQDASTPEPTVNSPVRTASSSSTARGGEQTHVAAGTKFTGVISGTTELLIDGEVDGEVRVKSQVNIGSKGRVIGEIEAQGVRIGGRVEGNIRAVDRVEIVASGSLDGDVTAKRVAIAEGAVVNGKVQMNPDKKAAPASTVPMSSPKPQQHSRPGDVKSGAKVGK